MLSFDNSIDAIENRIFYSLCGFALFGHVSIAVGNIFLVLSLLLLCHRIYIRRDDINLYNFFDRKLAFTYLLLLTAILISIFSRGIADALTGNKILLATDLEKFFDYYVYRLTPLFIVIIAIRTKQKIRLLAICLLVSICLNGLLATYDWLINIDTDIWRFSGRSHYMHNGTLLAYVIPLIVVWLLIAPNNKKPLPVLLLIYTSFLLLINGTRGVWIAVPILIVMVYLLIAKNKTKALLTISVSAIIAIQLIYTIPQIANRFDSITDTNTQSNSERLLMWNSAMEMIKDNPVTGIGFYHFRPDYIDKYISPLAKEPHLTHAHNNLLHITAESGILGALAFIAFWGYATYFSVRGYLKTKHLAYLAFFVILNGLMLHGITEYT